VHIAEPLALVDKRDNVPQEEAIADLVRDYVVEINYLRKSALKADVRRSLAPAPRGRLTQAAALGRARVGAPSACAGLR
jgi:hypothetical protein